MAAPTLERAQAHVPAEDPDGRVRYVVTAVVVSIVVAFATITGALLLFHGEVPQAVGVGAFTAFWGGGGFGVVVGMALHQLRVERDAARLAAAPDG